MCGSRSLLRPRSHSCTPECCHRSIRQWSSDDNYSHGFFVLPLAAYFAWERRAAARDRGDRRPSVLGLLVIVGSLLVYTAGLLGAELFLTRISMIGVIAGTVLFVWGWAHVRILLFPILFLLLMVPLPSIIFNQIAFPLQLVASQAGEAVITTAGIPVLREGNVLQLPSRTLEVAEACSGIRSLVSLLMLAIVLGYFTERRTGARVLIALAAVPIAIVANAARVAGTGLAAEWVSPAAAEGFFHTFSGWLVFVVAFAGLLLVQQVALALPRRDRAARSGRCRMIKRAVDRHRAARRQLRCSQRTCPGTEVRGRSRAARDAADRASTDGRGARRARLPMTSWRCSEWTTTSTVCTCRDRCAGGPLCRLLRQSAPGGHDPLATELPARSGVAAGVVARRSALTSAGQRPGQSVRDSEGTGSAGRPLLVPGTRPRRRQRIRQQGAADVGRRDAAADQRRARSGDVAGDAGSRCAPRSVAAFATALLPRLAKIDAMKDVASQEPAAVVLLRSALPSACSSDPDAKAREVSRQR